jgi:hypothetical protein
MDSAQRPLATDEIRIAESIADQGSYEESLSPLAGACAIAGCSYGYPTLGIAVPENSPGRTAKLKILVDLLGDVAGRLDRCTGSSGRDADHSGGI